MKEAKKNKVIIPDEFFDKNLLRYEMVLNKGVNRHLNADIRGGNLYSEDIYFKLAKLWIKNYHSIDKLRNKGINISIDKVKTEGDFDKVLLTVLAQQLGMEEINQFIKLMKSKKVFNHNEYYSRIKNKYRIMCNTEVDSEDIITEMPSDVRASLARGQTRLETRRKSIVAGVLTEESLAAGDSSEEDEDDAEEAFIS